MTNRIVSVILRGDTTNLTAKLTAVSASLRDVGGRMTGATKEAAGFRQGLSSVGDTAGRIGLVAAAGLTAIVAVTGRFDKQMSAVQAATHESAAAMEDLRDAAIKAGADTAFSASEAAQGIEELAKAGVSTQDILAGGLTGSLDLAAAGALGVGDAAEIAATAMTQFSLGGDQVTHIADLLAAGAGKAQGSVTDMGMALKQSGLVASQTGLTIEETTGTLAAFASAGLVGSDAGTSFKTMLQSLTPTGEKAANEMDRLGITAYDAQGNFIGMTKFADNLKNGLAGLSVEQQNATLKTIFGSDAVRAASVVFQQGGAGIQSWIDKVDDSGYAAETAATRLDNLAGDFEAFKGSLETALIGLGEGSQGGLRSLLQDATGVVNAFNKLPGPIKSTTVQLLGITAILGGGLWFTAKTVAGVTAMRANLLLLGSAGTRAAAAMKGLGIAAATFAAVDIGASIGDSIDTRSTKEVDKLGKSLQELAKTGKATGDLGDLFGSDLGGKSVRLGKDLGSIGESLKSLQGYADDNSLTESLKFFGSAGQSAGIVQQAEAIGDLDKALARLNENDPEAAAQAFQILSDKALATGASAADISAAFPSMTAAMDASATSAGNAGDAANVFGVELGGLADSTQQVTEEQKALDESNRKTANAFFDVSEGIDDADISLHDWISNLRNQADALTEFGANAARAGRRGLDEGLIQSLQEAGPAGAMRLKELANASERELDRANSAWRKGQRAIDAYITRTGQVPPKKGTEVDVYAKGALNSLDAVLDYLKKLRDKNITITTRYKQIGNPSKGSSGAAASGQTASAKGGAIPRAAGGSIVGPGTGTSDSIEAEGPGAGRYLLSNGEHVLTAREVDILGGQERVYAMRAAIRNRQFAFASGGAVGGGGSNGYMLPPGAQFRLVGSDLIELVDSRVVAGTQGSRQLSARAARRKGN